jgi:DNA polymerase-3 subunit gamma/tau
MTPSAQGPSTPPLQGSGAAAQGAQSSGSGRISLRRLSTSINGLLNRPQEEAQQQEEQLDKSQTSQFDQDQVEKEWLSMCNRMTAAYPGLSARMKNLLPHITEYPNIELVVDNSILLDQLNAIRSRIRATLAHYLHNGNIEFTIRLAKADEVTKIQTKRELFDEMRQKNPAIERLRQLLDLEMA